MNKMKLYEKPMVLTNEELAEGVYAASGDAALKCDSKYMKGVWQAEDTSSWWVDGVETKRGYKQQFGCNGCPANTGSGCGLLTHYVDSNYAASYDTDNGKRMPDWEAKGYGPDDEVTDWTV
jgi:hypothetical protein